MSMPADNRPGRVQESESWLSTFVQLFYPEERKKKESLRHEPLESVKNFSPSPNLIRMLFHQTQDPLASCVAAELASSCR
jgi:hypothetical protein